MFTGDRKLEQRITPRITPTLMFVGQQCGRVEKAINFYATVFHNAKVDHILRCGKDDKADKEGTIKHAGVTQSCVLPIPVDRSPSNGGSCPCPIP
jgi:predicted 3-demethylubiquinone-9 3-methyltransferase (glyoxalase superfamily)